MERYKRIITGLIIMLLVGGPWLGIGLADQLSAPAGGGRLNKEELEQKALVLNQRVQSLSKQGKIAEAIPIARKTLELSEIVFGPVHANVSADLISLANLYNRQGDYFNAEPLIKRAIEIDVKLYGAQHPEVAVDIGGLAYLYYIKGDNDAAEKKYREAIDMLFNTTRDSRYLYYIGEFHKGLGDIYNERKQYQKALTEWSSAEQIFEVADPDRAIKVLIQMAELERSRGNQSSASAWLELAQQLRRR